MAKVIACTSTERFNLLLSSMVHSNYQSSSAPQNTTERNSNLHTIKLVNFFVVKLLLGLMKNQTQVSYTKDLSLGSIPFGVFHSFNINVFLDMTIVTVQTPNPSYLPTDTDAAKTEESLMAIAGSLHSFALIVVSILSLFNKLY